MSHADSFLVIDPLGHEIVLSFGLCSNKDGFFNRGDIIDSISDVIEKPALIFKLPGSSPELCYYRSIGFGHTLLIKTRKSENRWLAFECIKDPGSPILFGLLKQGGIVYDQVGNRY